MSDQPATAADAPFTLPTLPEDVRSLQALVRALAATITRLEARCATAEALVADLQAELADLRVQLSEPREKPKRDSSNSSQPPSSDPAWRPPRKKKKRDPSGSGRKPGGQPGHAGHFRRLVPSNQADDVIPVEPKHCQGCGHSFPDTPPTGRRKLLRHQVTEIPPVRPHITEYQLFARRGPCCREHTWAKLPADAPRRCVGPRVQALVALLSGACRLSRRPVRSLLKDLFGVEISLGTVMAVEADFAAALERPYLDVQQAVLRERMVFVDETSWREAGQLQWLWTVCNKRYAFYRVDRRRNREACRKLLEPAGAPDRPGARDKPPEQGGVAAKSPRSVTTDRYTVYGYLDGKRRSFCWAHLIREFIAAQERGGVDAGVAGWVLDGFGTILEHWHRCRAGEFSREELWRLVAPLQEKMRTPLTWGRDAGSRATKALCRHLLRDWDSLWTWLYVEDGEPTNNRAERALRGAVLWRKKSFGHQSETGKQYVERMLTVVETLRLQGRNVWHYLLAVSTSSITGTAVPSLVK